MRVMPKRLANREAHTIASAAIHGAIMEGFANRRYNDETADRINEELRRMMDYHGDHSASMEEVEHYKGGS